MLSSPIKLMIKKLIGKMLQQKCYTYLCLAFHSGGRRDIFSSFSSSSSLHYMLFYIHMHALYHSFFRFLLFLCLSIYFIVMSFTFYTTVLLFLFSPNNRFSSASCCCYLVHICTFSILALDFDIRYCLSKNFRKSPKISNLKIRHI